MSLRTVERELEAIQRQMREDPRGYRKDGGAERHLELLRFQERLKAEAPPSAEAAQPEGLAEIEAELEKIDEQRRSDPQKYRASPEMQARQIELLQARDALQEGARHAVQLKATVDAARESVPDAEAFDTSFDKAFGSLSAEGQNAVRYHLGNPLGPTSQPASDEALGVFKTAGPECEAVLSEWGRDAGRRYATAEQRFDAICDSLAEEDEAAAVAWIKGLDAAGKAAVVRALAEG